MERDYDPEFDSHAPETTLTTDMENRELETVGSTTPSTPFSGQVEVAKKAKTDNSLLEWKLRAAGNASYLNLQVRHVTRNTILRYCWLERLTLKSILHETLSHLNSRVCFTCDCWSTCTTRGFLTLTAHFIDSNWSLKSRILNFRYYPPPRRGVDIYLFVVGLIKEWSLERKSFSITCDYARAMDVMFARLKSYLLSFVTLPVAGHFFHVRCFAHILNLIFQSGMKVIDKSVLKLSEVVNYIAGFDARLRTSEKCVSDSKCKFVGNLSLDCLTRWNSTYLMLKRALEAKDALVLFPIVDSSFDFSLTSEEWTTIQFVCRILGPFHSITELFSRFDYPTSNLYFAIVLAIEKLLVLGNNHEFEKYWGDYSTFLAIVVVLDPWYKMVLVRSAFSKLHIPVEVEAHVKEIYDVLVEMYNFYDTSPTSSST
ncbi:Zinc finger BED domain-containing protein RICESLEEPER 2 [Bienertia sinuspersici]